MPWSSRTTCTSPERPGSSREPVVCGNGRRTSTVTTTVATTRSSTRAAATYVVTRTARGQPRKVRHQSPGPERGADEGAGAGEPGWSLMVSVIVPCRMIGSRRGRVPARSPWQLPTRGLVRRTPPRRTVPTYQYACTECGHAFEQFQSFSDDALTVCPECDGRLRKVFNAVGVVFKGSGFYRTDSRSSGSSGSTASSGSSTSSSSDSSAGSSSSSPQTHSKPAESKPAAAAATKD